MPHYRTLLDPGIFIGAQDCQKDKRVTISRAIREPMPARGDDKPESAAMLYFSHNGAELPRKYKLPRSVMYGLSLTLGTEIDAWVGKEVTIFAAKCMSFGEVEECVRIRFEPGVDAKIRKWLKKRKAPAAAYMIDEKGAA